VRLSTALLRLSVFPAIIALSLTSIAQTPTPPVPIPPTPAPGPSPTKPADTKPGDKPAETKPPAPKPGEPKPYKDVITAEAKTEKGVFTVHRIDDKVYFEIPVSMYDKDMLWQTEIAQTGDGAGFGGSHVGERVIRFSRHKNNIFVRSISFEIRGDGKTPIQKAVDNTNLSPIIASLPIEAEGEGKSAVVNVSQFYVNDQGPVPAGRAIGGGEVDVSRSYIDRIKAFPLNIEGHIVVTFKRGPTVITTVVHHSLLMLPEKPMQARYFDSRVGYFTEAFSDYGSSEHRVVDRELIARYRLEKKDPKARISDPVKPIVYYVSREVPDEWRGYIHQAIEDWQPAFEQAGFSHAIIAKDAPSVEEDPNWDPEDARYSVIRWIAEPIENAMGPHLHDPRSGEIISAHVIVWHNMLKLAEQWYLVQCGCLDPRAQKLPLPNELEGQLVRYVIAHEVGHTLGLRHNHKASSSYTIAQLRNKEFTEKYGDEASIMDYGRFNYVAQPGDNAYLIPKVGPYDRFAIEWGYTPVPGSTTPEAEQSALDAIAARQITDPMLRFGGEDGPAQVDPTVQMEDLSNDPVAASTLGMKNIERIVPLLIPATTKFGESYEQLQEVYSTLLGQRLQELMHVAKLVGGVVETRYHAGRGEDVYTPVPRDQQARAVQFLLANAFIAPAYLYPPSIVNKIQFTGVSDRILQEQNLMLLLLLGNGRIGRMLEKQATTPASTPVYTVAQLVTDLQNGIWSELDSKSPKIDIYRRNLQRAYLKQMEPKVAPGTATQSDLRPIVVGALKALQTKVQIAIAQSTDPATQLHLRDCRTQLENILNPKFATTAAASSGGFFPMFLQLEESLPEARKQNDECNLNAASEWLNSLLKAVASGTGTGHSSFTGSVLTGSAP